MSVLVGKPAPDFTVPAVLRDGQVVEAFTLSEAIRGQHALLFFYPLDFTDDGAAELVALNDRMAAFRERGVAVVAVSIDSQFAHRAWRDMSVEQGGIGAVGYTLAADLHHDVAYAYDVQSEAGMALRGAFLIDRDGVVRSQWVSDRPLTRSIDEVLRLVDLMRLA